MKLRPIPKVRVNPNMTQQMHTKQLKREVRDVLPVFEHKHPLGELFKRTLQKRRRR